MAEVDQEYLDRFINFKNTLARALEKNFFMDLQHIIVSRILHPKWFGLRIMDGEQAVKEATIYTRGKFYDRFEEGIAQGVRLIFCIQKSALDKAFVMEQEIMEDPRKSSAIMAGVRVKLNRGRRN